MTGCEAPPRGHLFQERLKYNPFWMIVGCQLVNLTHWEAAEPVLQHLIRTYTVPDKLACTRPEELFHCLRPLGLWRRRATMLPRFADAWLQGRPRDSKDIMKLPGCGKYAGDSWAIFMEGRLDVEPNDGKLGWYLEKMRKER